MIASLDLVGVTLLWLVLAAGTIWWSDRQRQRSPHGWSIAEGFISVLVMLWCSSLGVLIFVRAATGTWTPAGDIPMVPAVLGTAAGGLLTVAFIRARADWRALGLVHSQRRWLLRALAAVPAFLGVSVLWGLLLQSLGVEPQQEISLVVLESWPSLEAFLMVGYGVLIAPLVEELLFRCFLLPPLVRRLGGRAGVAISAILFGVMHISDPQAVPPLIVLGAVLGWLRLASGSLWPALLLHIGNNAVAFFLLVLSLEAGGG